MRGGKRKAEWERGTRSVGNGSDKDRNITACQAGSGRRATATLDELMPLSSACDCVCVSESVLCMCACDCVHF